MSERGSLLEKKIDQWIKQLNEKGIHAHKNHAKRTISGLFQEGEPFDYEIIKDNKIYVFDAKECHADKFYISKLKAEQIKNLSNCMNHGAEAFFLVYFYPSKLLIKFSVDTIIKTLQTTKKFLTTNEGERFNHYVFSQTN